MHHETVSPPRHHGQFALLSETPNNTFNALAAGAFDYVPKNLSSTSLDILHIRPDLVAKIRRRRAITEAASSRSSLSRKPPRSSWLGEPSPRLSFRPAIVALGISTGGPKALAGNVAAFPTRPLRAHPDRAAHAPRLYRALRPAAEHFMLRPRARSHSRRNHSARRGLSRPRWQAHARRAASPIRKPSSASTLIPRIVCTFPPSMCS